jgi:hypothetical protein
MIRHPISAPTVVHCISEPDSAQTAEGRIFRKNMIIQSVKKVKYEKIAR